jgi:hypothetical protein
MINGRRSLTVVGIALSPRTSPDPAGHAVPDFERYGVMWMGRKPRWPRPTTWTARSTSIASRCARRRHRRRDRRDSTCSSAQYGGTGAYGRATSSHASSARSSAAPGHVDVPAGHLPGRRGVPAERGDHAPDRDSSASRSAVLKAFGYSTSAIGCCTTSSWCWSDGGARLGWRASLGGAWFGAGSRATMPTSSASRTLEYFLRPGVVLRASRSPRRGAARHGLRRRRAVRLPPAEGDAPGAPAGLSRHPPRAHRPAALARRSRPG